MPSAQHQAGARETEGWHVKVGARERRRRTGDRLCQARVSGRKAKTRSRERKRQLMTFHRLSSSLDPELINVLMPRMALHRISSRQPRPWYKPCILVRSQWPTVSTATGVSPHKTSKHIDCKLVNFAHTESRSSDRFRSKRSAAESCVFCP